MLSLNAIKDNKVVPTYFYVGKRRSQILQKYTFTSRLQSLKLRSVQNHLRDMINAYVVHQKLLNISFFSVTYTPTKEIQLSIKYPIKLMHLFFCQAVHRMMMQSMFRYLNLYKDSLLKVVDSIIELDFFRILQTFLIYISLHSIPEYFG